MGRPAVTCAGLRPPNLEVAIRCQIDHRASLRPDGTVARSEDEPSVAGAACRTSDDANELIRIRAARDLDAPAIAAVGIDELLGPRRDLAHVFVEQDVHELPPATSEAPAPKRRPYESTIAKFPPSRCNIVTRLLVDCYAPYLSSTLGSHSDSAGT